MSAIVLVQRTNRMRKLVHGSVEQKIPFGCSFEQFFLKNKYRFIMAGAYGLPHPLSNLAP